LDQMGSCRVNVHIFIAACCVGLTFAFQGSHSKSTTIAFHSKADRICCWGAKLSQPVLNPSRLYSTTSISEESVEVDNYDDDDDDDDLVIQIQPKAMVRLKELKSKQDDEAPMILRMGVRNGGCSGLSYVMDFSTEDAIEPDDMVDDYLNKDDDDKLWLKCVVDAKSMLYLYGLELDYSEDLIGGGFKFFNPNAEESCGCGSSFGV